MLFNFACEEVLDEMVNNPDPNNERELIKFFHNPEGKIVETRKRTMQEARRETKKEFGEFMATDYGKNLFKMMAERGLEPVQYLLGNLTKKDQHDLMISTQGREVYRHLTQYSSTNKLHDFVVEMMSDPEVGLLRTLPGRASTPSPVVEVESINDSKKRLRDTVQTIDPKAKGSR